MRKNNIWVEEVSLKQFREQEKLVKVLYLIECNINQLSFLEELSDAELIELKDNIFSYTEAAVSWSKTVTLSVEKAITDINNAVDKNMSKTDLRKLLKEAEFLKEDMKENTLYQNLNMMANCFREKGRLDIIHQIITSLIKDEKEREKYEELDKFVAKN